MASKYNLAMTLHMIIIFCDLCFNCSTTIFYDNNTLQLMLFL